MRHKKEGRGEMKYANGDTYDGEWAQDVRHGQGSHVWPSGIK